MAIQSHEHSGLKEMNAIDEEMKVAELKNHLANNEFEWVIDGESCKSLVFKDDGSTVVNGEFYGKWNVLE